MLFSLGCALFRYRRGVLAVWGLVLLVALPVAPRVFHSLVAGGFTSPDLEAFRASQLLADRLGSNPSNLVLVYEDPTGALAADDPRFLQEVQESLVDVAQLPNVERVTTAAENSRQIAPDRRAQYATISLTSAPSAVTDVVPAIQRALRPTPLHLTLTGAPVFYQDIFDVTERDLQRAELLSIPTAAVALVLVFGSIVAGAVPGLVGGAAVAVTLALMVLLSRSFELSIFSLNLATMLGLGLGIDYSLFIVSRFREELARGESVQRAVALSVSTAGRVVLFSGATVIIGLLALLTFDITALRSMGVAGALVVAMSLVAALTLLPAVLGLLGQRIDWLAIGPLAASAERARNRSGFWTRLANAVMARPVLFLLPLLVVLIGLGLPFLQVKFGAPDASILPTDVQSRRGFDLLQAHWGAGELSPMLLVLQTTDGSSPLRSDHVTALATYMRRVQADPGVQRVESVVSLDPRLTPEQYALLLYAGDADTNRISDAYARLMAQATVRQDTLLARVTSRFGQTDDRSKALVRAIRATPPPEGLRLLVGGGTAGVIDYADRLYEQFPRAAVIVVLAIYLVLLRTFGSAVLPLKAVIMNVLSILASYGALVVIFQEGALAGPLHFQPLGFVEASLPILMFCVLFGLSMDYEVFLLSRVQEAHLEGADSPTSVARGLERSGRIITSAAAIVVLVSLSFVAADIVLIKALGLGTAIAVFLDATLVRALLVPATMRLLGEWNWWAPRWLRGMNNRSLAPPLAALLGLLLVCAGCSSPVKALPDAPVAAPTPAPPIVFPRDAGPHDVLTEWWYYTGHLRSDRDGHTYGFEFVIFQSRRESVPSGYLAHFAVSDIDGQRFSHQASFIQIQGHRSAGLPIDINGWSLSTDGVADEIQAAMQAELGADPTFSLHARLTEAKPPALHHGGYIDYGPAGGSYYYSRTRMNVAGELADGTAERVPVSGIAWMDHQWGNFVVTSAGGWDWYSLQFEDNTELMLYVLRSASGETTGVYGSQVLADGSVRDLKPGDVQVEATGSWTSPHTRGAYPSGWRLTLPDGQRLELQPQLVDQELWFPGLSTAGVGSMAYWEGAVTVTGDRRGVGYVELTGYAAR